MSFLDRPTADLDNPTTGDPWDQLGAIIGPTTTPWAPDTAHQPSFSYVPYLVTGDLFYLEEVYFWPSWSLMGPTAGVGPPSREYDKGIIYGDGQPRARARVLQNVAAAAGIAPDADTIEKETWTASVVNTLAKWQTIYVNNTTDYPLVHSLGAGTGESLADMDADVYVVCSPWMDAYGVWALRHALELGLNPAGQTLTMLNWLGDQVINQYSAPGFNWNRKVYRMPIARRDQYQVLHYATTWAEVDDMFLDDVGPSDMPNPDTVIGYYAHRPKRPGTDAPPARRSDRLHLARHPHPQQGRSGQQPQVSPWSTSPWTMPSPRRPSPTWRPAPPPPAAWSSAWTAPGDDGSTGTAKVYDLRYSTQPITDTTWPRATLVSGEPTPAAAGTAQNKPVTGLAYDTTYYFAIKATDEKGNTSGLSNVPGVATSPLPGTQTITFQNGVLPTTGYAGCMDNQVHAGYPTTNYGNNDSGTIGNYGGVRRILVRFDVSAIPAGQNVVSAKLRLYPTGWGGGGAPIRLEAYEVLRAWTEMYSSWNNYDTGLAWTTAGCNGIGTDRSGTPAGTATFQPTVGQWVEVTLPSSLVHGWYTTGSSNKGLLLKNYNENGGYVVLASDSHTTAANRPMLVVKYQPNAAPMVAAGIDLAVYEGQAVHLHATASDPDNDPLDYLWTQTAGTSVALSGAGTPDASFTAPVLASLAEADMAFQVAVADGRGGQASDSCPREGLDAGRHQSATIPWM